MHRFRNLELFLGIQSDIQVNIDRPLKDAMDTLNDNIKHFELRAQTYKLRFRVFQLIVILAGGIIPIVNLSDISAPATRLISSMLASLIVIVTGLTQMDKNHEMWILKASAEHALKHEKLLFINGICPYDGIAEKKESVLVKQMNRIISSHLENYFAIAGNNRLNLTIPNAPNPNAPNPNAPNPNAPNPKT